MADIYDWSTTAADNDAADSTINWLEGQKPSTVNNSSRAMMKRVKELLNDISYAGTVGGTADAITLTSAIAALASNKIISFKATAANTAAATLAVNGLAATAIRKISGGTDVALVAGDIGAARRHNVVYDSAAGAWILINPATAVINLTGGQIAFPATQNASADANTLDDYEEGTWTPTLTFNAAAVGMAYSSQDARYTKIGRLVHVHGRMTLSSKGSSTGVPDLQGLPFTIGATRATMSFGQFSGMSGIVGNVHGQASGGTLMTLYHSAATGSAALADTNFGNTSNFFFDSTYTG